MSSVVGKRGGELLLMDGPGVAPEAYVEPKPGRMAEGSPRATQFAKALLAALDERVAGDPSGKAKYSSITAVVDDLEYYNVMRVLREVDDERLVEGRFPYLLFSGRTVARFDRTETQQELLVISALDFRRPTTDVIDTLFAKIMAADHPPDLVAFDLTEAAWRDVQEDYKRSAGTEPWQGVRPRGQPAIPEVAKQAT